MEPFNVSGKILVSATDIIEKCQSNGKYLFNKRELKIDSDLDLKEEQDKKIAEILNEFVGKQFENTVILTGAGSSIINNDSKDLNGYTGETVWGLTHAINDYLEDVSIQDNQILCLESFSEMIRYFDADEDYCLEKVNIEDMLSKASAAREFIWLGEQDQKKFNKTL